MTYGIERIAMFLQGKDSVFDLVWQDAGLAPITYRQLFHQSEVEQSAYNFEQADTEKLSRQFDGMEQECDRLVDQNLPLPAYEQLVGCSHLFNLLDARHAISVTERQRYILRIRARAQKIAEAYYASREASNFPLGAE